MVLQGQGIVQPDKLKKASDPVRKAANKVSSMLGGSNSSSYNSHMLRSNRQVLGCFVLVLVFLHISKPDNYSEACLYMFGGVHLCDPQTICFKSCFRLCIMLHGSESCFRPCSVLD